MGNGWKGKNLIFIISQPRSGSTLLQLMLAGHPEIGTTSEPWVMLHPVYGLRNKGFEAEYNFQKAREAVDGFLSIFQDGEDVYLHAIQAFGKELYNAACVQLDVSLFLDKTPRYYLILNELIKIFPDAYFIFLLRNPLAILASFFTTWVKGSWIDIGKYYIQDLIDAPSIIVKCIASLGEQAIVVHYEDLVKNPKKSISAICSCLKIDYFPTMLEYDSRSISLVKGDQTGIQKHNHSSQASLNKWLELRRTKQTHNLAKGYLKILGKDLVDTLGYDFDELMRKIDTISCSQRFPIVSSKRVFKREQSFIEKVYLLLIELIQQRHPGIFVKKLAKLILGRL